MEKTNRITVAAIVPVWNTADWMLEACMDSLLSQSYRLNEIIIVDDGSDNVDTLQCEQKYLENGIIKLICKDHSGISDTRNQGLDACCSDYVIFVDSDDVVLPDYVLKYVQKLYEQKCDYIVGSGHWIDNDGTDNMEGVYPDRAVISDPKRYPYHMWTSGPKMYNMAFLNKIDCRFPSGCANEDAVFSFYTSVCAEKVLAIDYPGYCVRKRQTSTCRTRKSYYTVTVNAVPYEMLKTIIHKANESNEYCRLVVTFQVINTLFFTSSVMSMYSDKQEKKRIIDNAISFTVDNIPKLKGYHDMNKYYKFSRGNFATTMVFDYLVYRSPRLAKSYLYMVMYLSRFFLFLKGIE